MTDPTTDDLVSHRLRSQRLASLTPAGPVQVVAALGAVQAQELDLSLWSLVQRSGADRAAVVAELDAGTILRTHVLRPTWQYVPGEDLRWMQRLTRDRTATQARYYASLVGADEVLVPAAIDVFERTLADGLHRTRAELAEALRRAGLEVPPRAMPHLTLLAELQDVLTSGTLRDGRPTYALVADRVAASRDLTGDEALAELTRRYLTGHGPATVRDLAWWASLTQAEARHGLHLLGDEVEWLTVAGVDYVTATWDAGLAEPDEAHLLQPFDELVVGYSQSRWLVYAEPDDSRAPSTLRYPLLVSGRMVGWWTAELDPTTPIRLLTARRLDGRAADAVERAAAAYAAFADRSPAVEWLDTSG